MLTIKTICTTIILLMFSLGLSSQCSSVVEMTINSITIDDSSNCPGGTGTITMNVCVEVSNMGNASACTGYFNLGGTWITEGKCWGKGESSCEDITMTVPCDAMSIGISGWTNPDGGGSQCTDPAPVTSPNPLALIGLPVELTSFSAVAINSEVLVSWSTQSERNNESFVLERSFDGITFIEISKILAEGDSNLKREYSILDRNPSLKVNNYYRLVQYDLDGDKQELGTIVTQANPIQDFLVYPNPATNVILVKNASHFVSVFDISGREILYKTLGERENTEVDLTGLNKGVYYVKSAFDLVRIVLN